MIIEARDLEKSFGPTPALRGASLGVRPGEIVAAVTRHSVERLDLQEGDDVTVLIKATEVMLAK